MTTSKEKFTEEAKPVDGSVGTPKRKKRPGNIANLKPWTHERSMAVQAKAAEAKRARSEMRRRLLAAVCEEGIDKYLVKALKSSNVDLMTCCEKAVKMTGLDFSSSPEAVQNVKVDANVDAKAKVDSTIKFVIEDAPPAGGRE